MPGLVLSIGMLVTFRNLGLPRPGTPRRSAPICRGRCRSASSSCSRCSAASTVLRGSGLRSRREQMADAAHVVIPIVFPGMIAVALFGFTLVLRRVPAQLAHGRLEEHAAARDLDDDDQRHVAGALRARHSDDRRLLHRDRHRARLDRLHPTQAIGTENELYIESQVGTEVRRTGDRRDSTGQFDQDLRRTRTR